MTGHVLRLTAEGSAEKIGAMDNAQVSAPDGSWFVFVDWQGATRIGFPGDKFKTNANFDRPNEKKPVTLRPSGSLRFEYSYDVDPMALTKVTPAEMGHGSPDPLGGPELDVGYDGASLKLGETELTFEVSGDPIALGGAEDRRREYLSAEYQLFADGSLVAIGSQKEGLSATYVTRGDDKSATVAWCRRILLPPNGAPDAFQHGDAIALVDRDPQKNVAFLVVMAANGTASDVQQATAVAGPWVHEGRVWWQPNASTVCAGPKLGEAEETFELTGDQVGPGKLLRVPGRKLLLTWHGTTIVDFAPTKKGKGELSRKHKKGEEPVYKKAAERLRPVQEGLAKQGIMLSWTGLTRSGKRLTPKLAIDGTRNLISYLMSSGVRDGLEAALGDVVSSVDVMGGTSYDALFAAAPTTAKDVRELVALLDEAGINRACPFAYLKSVMYSALERNAVIPWTSEAEALAAAAIVSGVLGRDDLADVTAEAIAEAAPKLGDYQACRDARINASDAAIVLAAFAHKRLGDGAAAPLMGVLEGMNPTYPNEARKYMGLPQTPHVEPVFEEEPLNEVESAAAAAMEKVLTDLDEDPETCREGRGWYRFTAVEWPFQGGVHDDFRVLGTLCKTSTDVDLGKLFKRLKTANKSTSGAAFEEADGYIHVKATCPLANADAATIKGLVDACVRALNSDAGQSLITEYKSYH